ncbi:MAG TPA: ABC transporter ATP-binding protein [Pseudomonadales bacterium]|nr:ABC transporter ATP-binding protein [Pseudomonadales bacterium]
MSPALDQHAVVVLENVVKNYPLGKLQVPALRGINLSLYSGEFAALVGASGSGKSTLLNMIGCIDLPTEGKVFIDGIDVTQESDKALTRLRLHKLGFIFQTFNLVNVLTVFQNVEMPLLLQGGFSAQQRRERVETLLNQVGLNKHLKHRPNELSGGQRQRVSIARALVGQPKIVLADEPTANLDSHTGKEIIDLMYDINQRYGTTFLFSTHDQRVVSRVQRVIRIEDGCLLPEDARLPTTAVNQLELAVGG